MTASSVFEQQCVELLSRLTLSPPEQRGSEAEQACSVLSRFTPQQRREFLDIANSHHVLVRALCALHPHMVPNGNSELAQWVAAALENEYTRIERALEKVAQVIAELTAAGCPVTTIKTLDHYPDFGSDVDLYTTAEPAAFLRVFAHKLKARVEPRSWGDRLAGKWNFSLPGLPELIEVHSQRLGQTGEQTMMARRFLTRRIFQEVAGYSLPVPAPEERVIVATLQRMYRHFYFRLSDMVNTAVMVRAGIVDFWELRAASMLGGIWPGVATYLKIASDYGQQYGGESLPLPTEVLQSACFGGEKLYVSNRFLRVPVMPEGAALYARQIMGTALRGNVEGMLRLSLLPPLASIAALSYRLTGSDKGIW